MVDITLVIERRQSFDYYVFTRFDIIPLRRYHVAYIKDGFSRSNKSVRRASKAPSLPLSSLVFQWVYFFSALVCLWATLTARSAVWAFVQKLFSQPRIVKLCISKVVLKGINAIFVFWWYCFIGILRIFVEVAGVLRRGQMRLDRCI